MRFIFAITIALAVLFVPSAIANAPITPKEELAPRAEHKRATRLITHFIANYHYKKPPLDDELSEIIFEKYVAMLDPTKSYLLQSDIDEFNAHRTMLDDYLRHSNLQPIYDMYIRYRERVEERIEKAISMLDHPFDFDRDESFVFDREDAQWAANKQELDELWRKRVKNDILSLSATTCPFHTAFGICLLPLSEFLHDSTSDRRLLFRGFIRYSHLVPGASAAKC